MPKHCEIFIGAGDKNVTQHSVPFPNFWRSEMFHVAAFLMKYAQLTLV